MKSKYLLVAGALLSGLGVAIGAVGAHALKPMLESMGRVETFETAIKYQLYHGLALLLLGILSIVLRELETSLIGWLMLTGVIFFSGSLYLLCLTQMKWVVYATPVGGMLMITGWTILLLKLIRYKK